MTAEKEIGYIDVVIYAGLEGEPPISMGIARIGLTLSTTRNKTFEVRLDEALDYVREDLKAVFGKDAHLDNIREEVTRLAGTSPPFKSSGR